MTARPPARGLAGQHERAVIGQLSPATCRHADLLAVLRPVVAGSGGVLTLEEAGASLEGRPIVMVSAGRGPVRVLLWSQMHGDEPTATLALADICAFLAAEGTGETWVRAMLARITVHLVPMLNPDGAEQGWRHTALHIDMNRDARALATPEARLLTGLHHRLQPAFAFNLHDQQVSSVGASTRVAALALLAPPGDEARTMTPSRLRAVRVASVIVAALDDLAGGYIARYDDTFEPRAFGDMMQSWGTPTVLVESGQWPGDSAKAFVRRLNFVALLTALGAIADGSADQADVAPYESLPQNGKALFDIVIRGAVLSGPAGWSGPVDVGLAALPGRDGAPRSVTVKEIGDLSTMGGLREIDGRTSRFRTTDLRPEDTLPLPDVLRLLGLPAET